MKWLFDLLVGLLTKKSLAAAGAGAGPDALGNAVTVSMDLPSFYTEPQPPVGVMESRQVADCIPYLQERWPLVQADFQAETGRQLFLTCTYRSKERQNELYQQGRRGIPGERIVTKLDGFTKRSRHNFYPSQALDVCVDSDPGPGKHPVWDIAAYAPLGPICARHGLVWGGDWNGDGLPNEKFVDAPHIEAPAGFA